MKEKTPEELQKTIQAEIIRHRKLFELEGMVYEQGMFAIDKYGLPRLSSMSAYPNIQTNKRRKIIEHIYEEEGLIVVWFKPKKDVTICLRCNGGGEIYIPNKEKPWEGLQKCPECKGSGLRKINK